MSDRFAVTVWDKTFGDRHFVRDYLQLTAVPRHNQQPTGSITLKGNDPNVSRLATPGARALIRYRDERCIGGPVRSWSRTGTGPTQSYTFQIEDDWRVLTRLLLWQVPGAALTAQNTAEYDVVTGPAETVVKTLLGAAITRLGLPITVATDLGRGDMITVSARMSVPTDVLFPLVDQAGIGVTCYQDGAGLVLDCYEPRVFPVHLSTKAGTLRQGDWSFTPPTVTRVVLGVDGDGTDRTFTGQADTVLEALWGDVIEQFVDARDLNHTDAGYATAVAARMQGALAAGAAVSGLNLTLRETSVFRYGGDGGAHVGDQLTVDLDTGVPFTDVLRTATLTDGVDGPAVAPTLGLHDNDTSTVLARAISNVAATVRKLQTRR